MKCERRRKAAGSDIDGMECGQVVKLTRTYEKYNRSSQRGGPAQIVVNEINFSGSVIKIGLDVHARLYVAVAQYDRSAKPARQTGALGAMGRFAAGARIVHTGV